MRQIIFLTVVVLAVSKICSSLSILTLKNDIDHVEDESKGGWGGWGAWQPCSRSCGGGVTYMLRHCNKIRLDGVSGCVGSERKYSSCNIQDCPDGAIDFRAEQCSVLNNRTFRGRTYTWEPYLGSSNLCELHCQPQDGSFFIKHANKVIDGTRCHRDTYDVCVDGSCQEVGCDMVLGSDRKEDNCKECGGDGSSCYLVRDTLVSSTLPSGYSNMIAIPAGATNIQIEQNRASRNYLAVRNAAGDYVLNGNWKITHSRAIQVVGTTLKYSRKLDRRRATERISAAGPTTEEMFIDLVVVQQRNRGIRYSFYLPQGVTNPNRRDLEWVASEWSKCSLDCGRGTQTRHLICHKYGTKVLPLLCNTLQRPQRKRQCNQQACMARWHYSNWTECSASCNGGQRFRQVYCTETPKHSERAQHLVQENRCSKEDSLIRPHTQEKCNEQLCPGWIVGNWSSCSVTCDPGYQTREVKCQPPFTCVSNSAPESVRECNIGPCTGIEWVVTAWSSCTRSCGIGMQTRLVHCASNEGRIHVDSLCSRFSKPGSHRRCRSTSVCTDIFYWMSGEWSECSAQCGNGMQTRHVACAVRRGSMYLIFPDKHCAEVKVKPPVMRNCSRPSCAAAWFAGSWSNCSALCGGGLRTRHIMCLSELTNMQVNEDDCYLTRKPDIRQSCNTHSCVSTANIENAESTDDVVSTGENKGEVVDCVLSSHGCCSDNQTAALGPSMLGCLDVHPSRSSIEVPCSEKEFGCCKDGVQAATGTSKRGCPEYDKCFVASSRGHLCGDWQSSWYFDVRSSRCEHFWYGGCNGNNNRYDSEEECEAACESTLATTNHDGYGNTPVPTTTSTTFSTTTTKQQGFSEMATRLVSLSTAFQRTETILHSSQHVPTMSTSRLYPNRGIYTDSTLNSRSQVVSPITHAAPARSGNIAIAVDRSAGGLDAIARTLRRVNPSLCNLPPMRGPCFQSYMRWYYDSVTHACRSFAFGGCSGNENNFRTRKQCQATCTREGQQETMTRPPRVASKCEKEQILARFEDSRVPTCDATSGHYRPLQCVSNNIAGTRLCWCVDPERGREIDGTRRYGSVAPDCSFVGETRDESGTISTHPCSQTKYGCCADGVTPYNGRRECPVPVRIRPGRTLFNVRVGNAARLPCLADGVPKPNVRWFKDGQELKSQTLRNWITIDHEHPALIFTSVGIHDAGNYVCQASNGVSESQQRIIRLSLLGETLRFRSRPRDVILYPGQTAKLKCRTRGGMGTISWFKNGRILRRSSFVSIKPWGDLRISETNFRDAGRYTCVANSAKGESISASASITLLETSSVLPVTATASITQAPTVATTEPFTECIDIPQYANCELILRVNMCEEYTKSCCATCRDRGRSSEFHTDTRRTRHQRSSTDFRR